MSFVMVLVCVCKIHNKPCKFNGSNNLYKSITILIPSRKSSFLEFIAFVLEMLRFAV